MSGSAVVSLPPDPHPAPPACRLPDGACDSHIHLFGPFDRYPLRDTRAFEPPLATPDMYRATAGAMGLSRAVVVQSAAYGHDHSRLADALAGSHGAWRGIALPDPTVDDAGLFELARAGVAGMRMHLRGMPQAMRHLSDWAARLRALPGLEWHIEVLLDLDFLHAHRRALETLGPRLVVDHMGFTRAEHALAHPGLDTFRGLLREGRIWTKLSGVDRIGNRAGGYADARRLCDTLVAANPDRLVWGSDWPHISRRVVPNDGELLNRFATWLNDPALLARILVANAAVLYGF